MKRILISLVCLLLVGCTAVAVREPVGSDLDEDTVRWLVGRWLGAKGVEVTIKDIPGSKRLLARYSEDGEDKEVRFVPTRLSEDCVVLWGEVEGVGFVSPVRAVPGFRAVLGEESVALLIPDLEAIKVMVQQGTLRRAPEEADFLYVVEAEGLEGLLVGKEFWDLTVVVPLLKKQEEGEPGATDNPDHRTLKTEKSSSIEPTQPGV
jgi:hypothetical protein